MTLDQLKLEVNNWRFTKERVTHLTIGLVALLIYEFVGRPYYRPYIYTNKIYDFHIADTLGNSLGTIATVFFFIFLLGRDRARDQFLMNTVIIAVAFFELIHPLLGKPIDPWDIAATLLAGGFCILVYRFLEPIFHTQ